MMQRAPTPKSEKPAVTIANLERENDNLAARIDELSKRNIDLECDRNKWRSAAQEGATKRAIIEQQSAAYFDSIEAAQAKIAKLESVLAGYRQAIADVHGHTADTIPLRASK